MVKLKVKTGKGGSKPRKSSKAVAKKSAAVKAPAAPAKGEAAQAADQAPASPAASRGEGKVDAAAVNARNRSAQRATLGGGGRRLGGKLIA